MCMPDTPDIVAPAPVAPPDPTPVFKAGSELDINSVNNSSEVNVGKKGKDALTTHSVDTGLGIPVTQ